MAKNTEESPADRVKRELAEKEAREKEEALAAAQQPTGDSLTAEELAALQMADEDDAKDREIAKLRDLVEKQDRELSGARQHISALQTANTETEEEDPAIVAERRRRFERAEAFEREHARRRGQRAPAYVPPQDEDAPTPTSSGKVSVTMDAGAFDVVRKLALAIPVSTPPEHVMCGYGGIKITVGTLRELAGVRMR